MAGAGAACEAGTVREASTFLSEDCGTRRDGAQHSAAKMNAKREGGGTNEPRTTGQRRERGHRARGVEDDGAKGAASAHPGGNSISAVHWRCGSVLLHLLDEAEGGRGDRWEGEGVAGDVQALRFEGSRTEPRTLSAAGPPAVFAGQHERQGGRREGLDAPDLGVLKVCRNGVGAVDRPLVDFDGLVRA